jgi:hypothetical protein
MRVCHLRRPIQPKFVVQVERFTLVVCKVCAEEIPRHRACGQITKFEDIFRGSANPLVTPTDENAMLNRFLDEPISS